MNIKHTHSNLIFPFEESRLLHMSPGGPEQQQVVPESYGDKNENGDKCPAYEELQQRKEYFEEQRDVYLKELKQWRSEFTKDQKGILVSTIDDWKEFQEEMVKITKEVESNVSQDQEDIDTTLWKAEGVLFKLKSVLAAISTQYNQRNFEEYARDSHWDAMINEGSLHVRKYNGGNARGRRASVSGIILPQVDYEFRTEGDESYVVEDQKKPLGSEYVYMSGDGSNRPDLVLKHPSRGEVTLRYVSDEKDSYKGRYEVKETKEAPGLKESTDGLITVLKKSEWLTADERIQKVYEIVDNVNSKYEEADLLPGPYWKEAVSKLNSRQQHSVEWVVAVDQEGKLKVTSNVFAQEAAEHDMRSFTPDQIPVGYKSVYEYRSFIQRQVEEANRTGVENKWAVNERARIGKYDDEQYALEDQREQEDLAQEESAGPSDTERDMANEQYGRGIGDLITALNSPDQNTKQEVRKALSAINDAVENLKQTPEKDWEHLIDLAARLQNRELVRSSVKIENGKYVLNKTEVDRLVLEASQPKAEEKVVIKEREGGGFEASVTPVVGDKVERDVDESGSGESVEVPEEGVAAESEPQPVQLDIGSELAQIREDISFPQDYIGIKKAEVQKLMTAHKDSREKWTNAHDLIMKYENGEEPLSQTMFASKDAYESMMKLNGAFIKAIEVAVVAEVHRPLSRQFSDRPAMLTNKLGEAQIQLINKIKALHSVLVKITETHRGDSGAGVLEGLPDSALLVSENLDALRNESKSDTKLARHIQSQRYIETWASPIRKTIKEWFKKKRYT